MDFNTAQELINICEKENKKISEIMRLREIIYGERNADEVDAKMRKSLSIMKASAHTPLTSVVKSMGGMIGGEASLLEKRRAEGKSICGNVLTKALIYSQAVLEVNASMGVIVAAPTAGSAGVVPAVLFALAEEFDISGISKSPAIFDPVKLKAINAEYIRKMTPQQFCEYITPYIKKYVKRDDIDYKVLASVLQPRTELYTDIEELIDFIDVLPEYDNALYCHKKMKTNEETSIEALNAILPVLEALDEWNVESIHTALFDLIANTIPLLRCSLLI